MPPDGLNQNFARNPLLCRAEPTLADLLARIEADQTADPIRRRDRVSAVRRFCALVGREPAMLPARIPDLRRPLESLTPVGTGLSAKTLSNMKANLLAVLREHGGCQSYSAARQHLRPIWKELMAAIPSQRTATGLSRFARFCSASGIAPDDVNDEVVERFMRAVHEATFARRPKEIHRRTCTLWNEAVETLPGWPQRKLAVPSYRKPRWTTPLACFPTAFRQDVEAYLAWLQDPLADPPPRHTCRPLTIVSIQSSLERAAGALVLAGKPVETFSGLGDLTSYDGVRTICRHYLDRNAGKPNTSIRLITTYLVQIAERWVKVPADELSRLKVIRSRLGYAPPGLTEKNRTMLRQFDDPANEERMLSLPGQLMAEALAARPESRRAAVKAQVALAIEILLNAPMRRRNQTGLRLDRHIESSGKAGAIVLPAEETKTAEPTEYPVPVELTAMLETYLTRFRPLLDRGESPYLFPSMESDVKLQSTLAHQIQQVLFKRAGLRLTEHQFRHLAAKFHLDAHPGDYGTVQRLLGHRNAKTTLNAYTGMDTARAVRFYDGVIRNLRKQQPNGRRPGVAPVVGSRTMPERSTLRFEDWPDGDRAAWARATAPGDVLDEGGPAAGRAASTRRQMRNGYARWLTYVMDTEPELQDQLPADRVSGERVRRYLADGCASLAPNTRCLYGATKNRSSRTTCRSRPSSARQWDTTTSSLGTSIAA